MNISDNDETIDIDQLLADLGAEEEGETTTPAVEASQYVTPDQLTIVTQQIGELASLVKRAINPQAAQGDDPGAGAGDLEDPTARVMTALSLRDKIIAETAQIEGVTPEAIAKVRDEISRFTDPGQLALYHEYGQHKTVAQSTLYEQQRAQPKGAALTREDVPSSAQSAPRRSVDAATAAHIQNWKAIYEQAGLKLTDAHLQEAGIL